MTVGDTLRLKELDVSRTYTSDMAAPIVNTPANFVLKSEFKTGNWANAIQASLNYGTAGLANGIGATISADLIPRNGSLDSGAYYCAHFSVGPQASTTWAATLQPIAFMRLENWGTAGEFDDKGYLFHLTGVNVGNGQLFANETPTTGNITHSLKILIGTTEYFIPLSTTST